MRQQLPRLILTLLLGLLTARTPAQPNESAATGRVLVLDNERTLEGDIQRQGDQYRIRRALGETWVAGAKVLCLCGDRAEAYAFLRNRANLRDADERLRLAHWCHQHNLPEQALTEVAAAVELRPTHQESQRLLRNLQRSAAVRTSSPASAPVESADPGPAFPPVAIDARALSLFTQRVHPILLNTCLSCHATGKGGSFRLTRPNEDGMTLRRATQLNLAAALLQLNREHLPHSPLLLKAVSVHGDAIQPPLKDKQSAAFRALEEWARLALENMPAAEVAMTPNNPPLDAKALAEPVPVRTETRPTAEPVTEQRTSVGREPAIGAIAPPPPAVESRPVPPKDAGPADPFDPIIFNRQMHPDK